METGQKIIATSSSSEQKQMAVRAIFSLIMIGTMALFTFKDGGQKVQYLPQSVCTYDVPFDLTDKTNTMFLEKTWMKDCLIIFDSWTFDLATFGLLYLFGDGVLVGTACFWTLLWNAVSKAVIQENLLTFEQPDGFNWYYPAMYSFVIQYYDLLDFFYSGHVSTSLVLAYGWFI